MNTHHFEIPQKVAKYIHSPVQYMHGGWDYKGMLENELEIALHYENHEKAAVLKAALDDKLSS